MRSSWPAQPSCGGHLGVTLDKSGDDDDDDHDDDDDADVDVYGDGSRDDEEDDDDDDLARWQPEATHVNVYSFPSCGGEAF